MSVKLANRFAEWFMDICIIRDVKTEKKTEWVGNIDNESDLPKRRFLIVGVDFACDGY